MTTTAMRAKVVLAIKTGLRYDKTTKPYRGSRKRAIQLLGSASANPLSEEQFLEHMAATYPDVYTATEWIRFHCFESLEQPGRLLRIAVVSLEPRPLIRDQLFRLGQVIATTTGWYPLAQGSRAQLFNPPFREASRAGRAPALKSLGTLRRVVTLMDSDNEGSGFVVEGTEGSLLLDAGMGPLLNYPENLIGTVLSHLHRDHSGGIWAIANQVDAPILMTESTLTGLWMLSTVPPEQKQQLGSITSVVQPNQMFSFEDGFTLTCFPSYHAPGALGIQLKDADGHLVVYFGDLCLKNGFNDFRAQALHLVLGCEATERYVILDATMAGRKEEVIAVEDTPSRVLEEVTTGAIRRNIVFVGSPETLIYAYLHAFNLTRNSQGTPIRMLVSPSLYQVIRTMLKPYVLRQSGAIDPLIRSVIGNNLTNNFAESHRLYPLTAEVLAEVPVTEPVIFFAREDDLAVVDGLAPRMSGANVYLSGTTALRSDTPRIIDAARPRSQMRVASPDWSFHSSDADLVQFVNQLVGAGVRVGLFHRYANQLKKFIKLNGWTPEQVSVMSRGGMRIS